MTVSRAARAVLALVLLATASSAVAMPGAIRKESYWYDDPDLTILVGQGILFCDNTNQAWGRKTEYAVHHVYGCG